MAITKEIKTSVGTFILKKPKAGVRNRALIQAEKSNGVVSRMTFLTYLLPDCIAERPSTIDKDIPIVQILDGLEVSDYDLLVEGLESDFDSENLEEKKTP